MDPPVSDPPISPLCQTCSSIDFPALVWPGSNKSYDEIILGTVQEIKDRRLICDLCSLIAKRLDQVVDSGSDQTLKKRCKISLIELQSVADPNWQFNPWASRHYSGFLARAVEVLVEPVADAWVGRVPRRSFKGRIRNRKALGPPQSLLHLQGCIHPVPTVDHLCNGDSELLAPPQHTRCSGRLRNDTINPLLYRRWLEICQKHHGGRCKINNQRPILNLRVIDVQTMSIRLAPANCEYVALSYCWGSTKTITLTLASWKRLSEPDSIILGQLPDTIADAIRVTRDAGIQYLWVDALCIVQDDPATLQSQIQQMAQVYERAIFTIIAAASGTADDGLAGVRSGSRSVSEEVVTFSDMSLIVIPENYLDSRRQQELDSSRWRSRAWTLQEELFSLRCLYFRADRITWYCPSAYYQEDTVKETPFVFNSDLFASDYIFWIDLYHLRSAKELDFSWYPELIREYSVRRMSYVSDALNALAGYFKTIRDVFDVKFHWGLPETWFVQSLLWLTDYEYTPNSGVQRTISPTGTEILVPFPSWSWSAWIGGSDNDAAFRYRESLGELIFEVKIYRCTLDTRLKPIPYSCINPDDPSDYRVDNREEKRPDWVRSPRQIAIPKFAPRIQRLLPLPPSLPQRSTFPPIDSGHLQFWSSIARVYVAHYDPEQPYDRQLNDYVLLDNKGEKMNTRCSTFGFIPDANITCTSMLDWDDQDCYERYPLPIRQARHNHPYGIHEVLAVALEASPDGYHHQSMVSILLVVQEGEIFRRIGAATVKNSQWLSLAPEWSLITLG